MDAGAQLASSASSLMVQPELGRHRCSEVDAWLVMLGKHGAGVGDGVGLAAGWTVPGKPSHELLKELEQQNRADDRLQRIRISDPMQPLVVEEIEPLEQ